MCPRHHFFTKKANLRSRNIRKKTLNWCMLTYKAVWMKMGPLWQSMRIFGEIIKEENFKILMERSRRVQCVPANPNLRYLSTFIIQKNVGGQLASNLWAMVVGSGLHFPPLRLDQVCRETPGLYSPENTAPEPEPHPNLRSTIVDKWLFYFCQKYISGKICLNVWIPVCESVPAARGVKFVKHWIEKEKKLQKGYY